MNWIKTSERLPDVQELVLAVDSRETIYIAYCFQNIRKNYVWSGGTDDSIDIEYWMEIPPLPEDQG